MKNSAFKICFYFFLLYIQVQPGESKTVAYKQVSYLYDKNADRKSGKRIHIYIIIIQLEVVNSILSIVLLFIYRTARYYCISYSSRERPYCKTYVAVRKIGFLKLTETSNTSIISQSRGE